MNESKKIATTWICDWIQLAEWHTFVVWVTYVKKRWVYSHWYRTKCVRKWLLKTACAFVFLFSLLDVWSKTFLFLLKSLSLRSFHWRPPPFFSRTKSESKKYVNNGEELTFISTTRAATVRCDFFFSWIRSVCELQSVYKLQRTQSFRRCCFSTIEKKVKLLRVSTIVFLLSICFFLCANWVIKIEIQSEKQCIQWRYSVWLLPCIWCR